MDPDKSFSEQNNLLCPKCNDEKILRMKMVIKKSSHALFYSYFDRMINTYGEYLAELRKFYPVY